MVNRLPQLIISIEAGSYTFSNQLFSRRRQGVWEQSPQRLAIFWDLLPK